jgi:hypothetical protein
MTLNVDASNGEVKVQVLDAEGRPIPGFTAADCRPARGDALAVAVRWRRPLAKLAGHPVRLEFLLKNARLFAFDLWAVEQRRQ